MDSNQQNITVLILLLTLSGSLATIVASPFIYGGEKAYENQFPFLVSFRFKNENKTTSHVCGASIISDRFLVTAGHCHAPNRFQISDYRISVGAKMRTDEGQLFSVKQIITHPDFFSSKNLRRMMNDIALIEMMEPFQLNENISSIEIGRNFINDGEKGIAAGWGRSQDGYDGLKYAELTTMSNEECRKRTTPNAPVKDFSTLCAYSGKKGTGICQGDSGGPLFINNQLIGISSWARLCALGDPDGFTRISEFTEWIDETMKKAN